MCNKLGLRPHAISKQSKHLDYEHPAMEAIRVFIQNCHKTHQINKRLVGHFDQVWTVHYQPATRSIFKPADKAGTLSNLLLPSEKKALAAISEALGLEQVEASREHGPRSAKLNAAGHQVPVDQARQSRTTTTLSWADGQVSL